MTVLKDRDYIYGFNIFDTEIKKYYDYSKDFKYSYLYIANFDKVEEDWIEDFGIDIKRLTFSSKERVEVKKVKKEVNTLKSTLLNTLNKLLKKADTEEKKIALTLMLSCLEQQLIPEEENQGE